ncbi:MAG TPA: Asp-tRNA(Asn)/Glu-tRNA(Gln) amidotransferase subunit GatA [Candidatus Omnitrophota bacterium]|nr:Asp-tRNA(Asn)/Glu-tRNA(Gln) amidotransferase subunit GatA [Candidatus Omnitrophota bacterium]
MMTTVSKLKQYLEEIKKNDKKGNRINAFIHVRDEKDLIKEAEEIDRKIKSGKAGRLAGKIIAVKSNINVKGEIISCASKTLENYHAPYDATVIEKIKQEDGLIIGMANMDEFACGSSGETSAFGAIKNPVNTELVPGGSSSGSAASVAAGFCDMALGSDTGGSIRMPSSCCGIVGIKPTYSSVSRYGLIDLSMSLDQIGSLARNVSEAALLLDVIRGKDERDSISEDSEKINLKEIEKTPQNLTIGILDFEIGDRRIGKIIKEKTEQFAKKFGFKTKNVLIKNIDLAVETYYPIVYVEFFSATRRFDGRRYGEKIEDAGGQEVLRRILGGSEISREEFSGRYYYKALKIKNMVEKEFSDIFKNVDCIISATVPKLPHKLGTKISVREMYEYDALTIPSNLAGNCAISIPAGELDGIPVGLQITCDKFQEQKMLQIARAFEKLEEMSKI